MTRRHGSILSRARLAAVALAAASGVAGTALAATAPASDDTTPPHAAPVNWPQFRGPGALPVSANEALPRTWSKTENVEWVSEIPGMGWSSPIVWGDRVFVTTAVAAGDSKQPSLGVDFSNEYVTELTKQGVSEEEVEKRIYERDLEMPDEVTLSYRLLCLDLETGKTRWEREFHQGHPPVGRHRKNSFTSETPVTDGRAVYVYVAHLGLWAYDFEGKELWHTPLQAHQVYLDFGGGASPALAHDRVFILNDNEEESFVAAFDARTGAQLWRKTRPDIEGGGRRSGWSTPFVWSTPERTELVTVGPGLVISYDLDGAELWRIPIGSMITITSPFAWDGALYVSAGAAGEPSRPLAAVRPGASGTIPVPEEGKEHHPSLLWYQPQAGGSYLPTPVIYRGRLYSLTDKGILSAHDARTGEEIYRARVDREARNFTASLWAYGGAVFMINEEGTTFVVGTGDQIELLGVNRLDEFVEATPAIAGDRLLVRTKSRLYSIREATPAAPGR